jgi:Family of unknown function (DUF6624)
MVWVSSGGWGFEMRSEIAVSALAITMLMTVRAFPPGPQAKPQRGSPSASDPRLAAEINRLFNGDLKGALPSDKVHSRVRLILAEHGVPTNETVGEEASEEYVVLLSGESLSFVETVLPRVRLAAEDGKISENSYVYLRAQARRKLREKFSGPPANPDLAAEIERLGKADQAVRPAGKKTWDNKKVEATDRADGVTARAIFAKYGLPTFALVGPEAAESFATVIQHQPLAFQEEVLPQMKVASEAGQISAESYAMLLDRVESNSGKPQTYGENFVCAPDGKGGPSPIADPEHVDRRRAEMGLMPLDLYAKALGELYMNNLCAQIARANKKAAPHMAAKSR